MLVDDQIENSITKPNETRGDEEKRGVVDVSIVMPCLNERLALPSAIESALNAKKMFSDQGMTCEIIVSDNGSTDGSVELAKEQGCRVVQCPVKGYGNALRYGITKSKGRFIVMGDSDGSYDFAESVPPLPLKPDPPAGARAHH